MASGERPQEGAASVATDSQQQPNWHALDVEALSAALGTNLHSGLPATEAAGRLQRHGANAFEEKPPTPLWREVLGQFKDILVLLLVGAAIVSFAVALWHPEEGFTDSIVIVAILVLNAVLGVTQERKAGRALDALKKMTIPQSEVVRDGHTVKISSQELVPGDLLILREGDFVPADVRLVEAHSLRADEASLTGESEPVDKSVKAVEADAALAERQNMAYAGTSIAYGRGRGVVIATGMAREIGRIAQMLQESERVQTPLQRRLAGLGKLLAGLALSICGIIFVVGLVWKHIALLEIFMIAVSLAVAAIPEGLPAIVTIVLALGVYRMSKRNAIVRKLPAVETLGSATFICTDKTGTLTQNRMTVQEAVTMDQLAGGSSAGESRDLLMTIAALCNDSQIQQHGQEIHRLGDPTELALLDYVEKQGKSVRQLRQGHPRLSEAPFDSDRKRMSTLHDIAGRRRMLVKGAPDVLLDHCRHYLKAGQAAPLTEAMKARAHQELETMANRALRVLAFAYKDAPDLEEVRPENEQDLTFVGLMGMIDPPRPEVKAALDEALSAGIETVMITGDNPLTAKAIADDLQMLGPGHELKTGKELDAISDDALRERAEAIRVYARVRPEQKLRIVQALQARGQVVAMTGDGVNDAPALKRADIGVAMGITGTDVAKETADVVLTDDNFATIVHAIEAGRVIFDNIRKFVVYLLACNLGELFAIFVPLMIWGMSPLVPVQILLINLVTDGLPALALGVDAPEADIMRRRPRHPREGIVNWYFIAIIAVNAAFIALAVTLSFYLGWKGALAAGMASGAAVAIGETMAFVTLAMDELWRAFSFRSSRRNIWQINPRTNLYLAGACGLSALVVVAVVTVEPLRALFRTAWLDAGHWGLALALSLVPVAAYEVWKMIYGIYAAGKAEAA